MATDFKYPRDNLTIQRGGRVLISFWYTQLVNILSYKVLISTCNSSRHLSLSNFITEEKLPIILGRLPVCSLQNMAWKKKIIHGVITLIKNIKLSRSILIVYQPKCSAPKLTVPPPPPLHFFSFYFKFLKKFVNMQ